VDWATHVSCTVEVVDLEKEVDVAVIDEIQMIGDPDRGWAWTQAVLGVQVGYGTNQPYGINQPTTTRLIDFFTSAVQLGLIGFFMSAVQLGCACLRSLLQAREIHVCGDPAAIPVLERLAELTGDIFEVQSYERRWVGHDAWRACQEGRNACGWCNRSTLQVLDTSLGGDHTQIQRGDCVVAFSRKEIHSLRSTLELKTGNKCCVVYGKVCSSRHCPCLCGNMYEWAFCRSHVSRSGCTAFTAPAGDTVCASSSVQQRGRLHTRGVGRLRCDWHGAQLEHQTRCVCVCHKVRGQRVGVGVPCGHNAHPMAAATGGGGRRFDGKNMVKVPPPSMKQIAGRAGRFGSRWPVGQVTCLYEEDMPWLHESLAAPVEPMEV